MTPAERRIVELVYNDEIGIAETFASFAHNEILKPSG